MLPTVDFPAPIVPVIPITYGFVVDDKFISPRANRFALLCLAPLKKLILSWFCQNFGVRICSRSDNSVSTFSRVGSEK